MNKRTFLFLVLIIGLLAFLVVGTMRGSLVSVIVLTSLGTITLVCIGASIALVSIGIANKKAQRDFVNNARENLAIMQGMQTIQNKQNQSLLQQVNRMPEPNGSILIEDGIFDELEQ